MLKYSLVILLCFLLGCVAATQTDLKPDRVVIKNVWMEVDCDECAGSGKVTYDKDRWIVVNGLGEAGTYTCPMCGGGGKLFQLKK